MSHGNTLGPRCIHCNLDIYHTAPGGHWAHTQTGRTQCPSRTPNLATPQVAK